ncbi:MAG: hypothetical protein KBS84_08055 [Treponema sp.]|nr:hypothetical protein [Candidatus Treponema scatequi]
MAEKYELAEKDYKKGMKYKDIAEKYSVSINTVKSWKTRKWGKEKSVHTKSKSVHTKKDAPKKRDRPNRSGNPNPKNQFTKRNEASTKHGFYRQWLPQDMMQIIEETKDFTLADRLWFQIETKFAALIQLHKIMFVENSGDTLREIEEESDSKAGYKVVYAFEQYEAYIRTEARLTSEWRNVVKQFLELSDEYDERRMKLEQMQLNITKTQTEIDKLNAELSKDDDQAIEIVIKRKGDD